MVTTNLGISPVLSFIQLLVVALPVLAWIALYVRGAEARDLLVLGRHRRSDSDSGSTSRQHLCSAFEEKQDEARGVRCDLRPGSGNFRVRSRKHRIQSEITSPYARVILRHHR